MVFHWSLRDSKSPQVSWTLLSILSVLNNAVFWMDSTRPPTSKSSSPFNSPFFTVPKAPITIGIIVTFMFHSFFNSLARSRYLSFFSHLLLLFNAVFSLQRELMVFHWSLIDSQPLQVSKTLLSLLTDLNKVALWMVSACPLISNSYKSLGIVPSTSITIGITVIFVYLLEFFTSE